MYSLRRGEEGKGGSNTDTNTHMMLRDVFFGRGGGFGANEKLTAVAIIYDLVFGAAN